jgi:hypothetical protein
MFNYRIGKFVGKTGFVGVLKQSGTKRPVNLQSAAQEFFTDLILIHIAPPRISAISAVVFLLT